MKAKITTKQMHLSLAKIRLICEVCKALSVEGVQDNLLKEKALVSGLTTSVRRSRSHLHRNESASTKDMERSDTFSASWNGSESRNTFAPYAKKLRSPTNGEKGTLALWDMCDGCILWLPLEHDRGKSYGPLTPPDGVLGHPVLVLHVSVSGPENAVVTFATMRSFKDDGPDESHPLFWDWYLKIATADSQDGDKLNGTISGKAARGMGKKR